MTGDTKKNTTKETIESQASPLRMLPPAAVRAIAEAEEWRQQAKAQQQREIGGRGGPDPARYGDWEVKGIASDF